MGLALAGCGGSHTRYVTVPRRAQQTDVRGAYDLLHRLGLRVALTRATQMSSLDGTMLKLSPHAHTRIARGTVVTNTPVGRLIGSPPCSNRIPTTASPTSAVVL
jgi:beta-lactam-binding protein with PASTA domain